MKSYLCLFIAIAFEIIATSSLKASNQFSRLLPSVITVIGYLGAFYFFSITIKTMNLGIAYALWAGIGIVAITLIGFILYKQKPDLPAILGIVLIIAGVAVINLFSKTTTP